MSNNLSCHLQRYGIRTSALKTGKLLRLILIDHVVNIWIKNILKLRCRTEIECIMALRSFKTCKLILRATLITIVEIRVVKAVWMAFILKYVETSKSCPWLWFRDSNSWPWPRLHVGIWPIDCCYWIQIKPSTWTGCDDSLTDRLTRVLVATTNHYVSQQIYHDKVFSIFPMSI